MEDDIAEKRHYLEIVQTPSILFMKNPMMHLIMLVECKECLECLPTQTDQNLNVTLIT